MGEDEWEEGQEEEEHAGCYEGGESLTVILILIPWT